MRHQNIAARVLNTPLLLEPGYARVFIGALAPRLGIASLHDEQGLVESQEKLRMRADAFEPDRERQRPYQLVDGIAIVPVSGSLVHKFGYLQPFSGMTGYDGIIANVEQAIGDTAVRGILLDIDSPGGEVSGCFDCARRLTELRGAKPIGAIAYDMACSGAMAIYSAADIRYITGSARVGSVGVVMMHASFEQQLAAAGVDVTLIHSGAMKVDGNPYQQLPPEVLGRFQAESDALRQEFAELIAEHMSLNVADVLATEAGCFRGQAAIDIGFADELINGNDMIAAFADYLTTTPTPGATTMPTPVNNNPAAVAPEATPQATSPQAAAPEADSVDVGQITAQASAAERTRLAGILNAEEAKGRETLANHLAFSTSMSAEEAVAVLASAETGTAPETTPLDAAMSRTRQPEIGADNSAPEAGAVVSEAAGLVSAYRSATGRAAK